MRKILDKIRTNKLSGSAPTAKGVAYVVSCTLLLSCAVVFLGCEAGGGESKVGGGGTGDAPFPTAVSASGPVTSFGTLGVAGNSLDESKATTQINTTTNRSVTELRLGMTVDVIGNIPVANSTQGNTSVIVAQSTVQAPVKKIDITNQRIIVLGYTIQLDQNTILDGFTKIDELRANDRIEVFGLPRPTSNEFLATRVALYRNIATTDPVEIVGVATDVGSGTFSLQGLSVISQIVLNVQNTNGSPATPLVSGNRVRLIGQLETNGTVTPAQIFAAPLPVRANNTLVSLDGPIQSLVAGAPGQVIVNDVQVDASSLSSSLVTALAPGVRVQLRSRKDTGVPKAFDGRIIAATDRVIYQFDGTISDFTSRALFKVRGETVNASTATFISGTVTDLAAGKKVRIKAVAGAGVLDATEVTLLAN